MTANLSLQLSEEIKSLLRKDLTGHIQAFYPEEKLSAIAKKDNHRDRIYTDETTMLTMLLSAVQQDKSMHNTVNIFSEIHKKNIEKIQSQAKIIAEAEREADKMKPKRRGRPKQYKVKIAKSMQKEISKNTGSYTTARKRLDPEMLRIVYEDSANFANIQINNKWKGMPVEITDGTYLQLQDTALLRAEYDIISDSANYKAGYPQALLQVVTEQGSGAIKHFEIGSRHVSELELISRIIPKIDKGTLLLADDLYSCYAIFCLIKENGLEIIVPGKRERNYKTIKKVSEGDEIVELKMKERPKWLPQEKELPKTILMRRLTFENPINAEKKSVIYTTILNEKINKTDIVLKYFTRWDIEISIREIKTLMDINVLRGQAPDIIMKELITALTAYNLVRKIIARSTERSGFSPQEGIIQKCFAPDKDILMDKKGRIYSRRSPGRYGGFTKSN